MTFTQEIVTNETEFEPNCSVSLSSYEGIASINMTIFLVFDFLLAILTITGNGCFMITLMKTRLLHTPSNMLLGALCFSDMLVGYVVQPLFLAYFMLVQLRGVVDMTVRSAMYKSFYFCGGLSFFNTVLISVDRYTAVCHPFKYHRFATCGSHIIAGILLFLLWALLVSLEYVFAETDGISILRGIYLGFPIMIMAFSYLNIYAVLRRNRNAVIEFVGSTEGSTDAQRRKRERQKTNAFTLLIVMFMVCYGPLLCLLVYARFQPDFCWTSRNIVSIELWAIYVKLWNSLLNPMFYYLRSKDIREAVWKTLRPSKLNVS